MPKKPRAEGEELERLERERGVIPTAQFRGRHYQIVDDVPQFSPDQIKALRRQLSCSQRIFAPFIGVGTQTLRGWEQGLHVPTGSVHRLMDEIRRRPDYWRARLAEVVTRKSKPSMRKSEPAVSK